MNNAQDKTAGNSIDNPINNRVNDRVDNVKDNPLFVKIVEDTPSGESIVATVHVDSGSYSSLDIYDIETFVNEMGYNYSEVYNKLVEVLNYAVLISSAYIINGVPYLRIYIHRPSRLTYLDRIRYAKEANLLKEEIEEYIEQFNREAMLNIVNTRNFIELIIDNNLFDIIKDEFNKRLLTVSLNLSDKQHCKSSIDAFRYLFIEEDSTDNKIIEAIAFNVDVLVNLIHLMEKS